MSRRLPSPFPQSPATCDILERGSKIVIIGAGATGRGQIGQIAHDAGFDVTFIERRKDLVARLAATGRYVVDLAGEEVRRIEVSGFTVLHSDDIDACAGSIAHADIVATAVLPPNLASTVPMLAAGLALRQREGVSKPLNVIACENMERSSSTLRDHLRAGAPELDWDWIDAHVGFPDSMVARAVPEPKDDPLVLLAEADQEWSVDAVAVKEPMPRLAGMTLSGNQAAALERKLYIKNTGHMAIGVLGFLKGVALMHEAARDPEIFDQADRVTRESAAAIVAEHGFDPGDTESYRATFLVQMTSPYLPDPVARVVRDPVRKLAREERLVGPAVLAYEHGLSFNALARIIAATFTIRLPGDVQCERLERELREQGLDRAVQMVCGIGQGHPLAGAIRKAYDALVVKSAEQPLG